jgi:hypothetical protein
MLQIKDNLYVDHGYAGERGAEAAKARGVELCVAKLARGEKRLRPITQTLGRRTFICVDDAKQTAGERLRTLCGNARRFPCCRFRMPLARASRRVPAPMRMTPFRKLIDFHSAERALLEKSAAILSRRPLVDIGAPRRGIVFHHQ